MGYGDSRSEDPLRDADVAMYRAKVQGANHYQVFDASMRTEAVKRLTLETELRNALERRELVVYYQPIFTVANNALCGFEALLRWQHPDRGLLFPSNFLDAAAETALVTELDRYALAEACAQLSLWQKQGVVDGVFVNVNLSSQQFVRSDFVDFVATVLRSTALRPERLNLEITQTLLMGRIELVDSAIRQLKRLGVGLHIDDFGKGYSSLAYLQRFPADALKIDRSFTQQLSQDGPSGGPVKTMLSMAQALGMKAVAEGVETVAELEHLKALGCEYGQGYFYFKPLSAAQMTAFLAVD